VANLVTRARISADLYRRQLRPVPARSGKRVGRGLLARPPLYVRAIRTCRGMRARRMIVELYKDEKLMPGHGAEACSRARREPPPAQRHIGFCPNPQSLRALMTARHDPPGKILGDLERATSNMQRGSNLRLCRGAARAGDRGYGERGACLWRAVCQTARYGGSRYLPLCVPNIAVP